MIKFFDKIFVILFFLASSTLYLKANTLFAKEISERNLKFNILPYYYDSKIKCPKEIITLTNSHLMGGQNLQKELTNDDLNKINKVVEFSVYKNNIINKNKNSKQNKNIYYGCVTTQVVAGINYRFTLLYNKTYYRATVWKKLNNEYQLSSFEKIKY